MDNMIKDDLELIYEAYLKEDTTTSYGCLMIYLDDDSAEEIRVKTQSMFPPEILADDGVDDKPHITCQYGFHEDVTIEEITEFCNKIKTPINIELGDISRFSNDEYDVIKVDVRSDDLMKLSKAIRSYFEGRITITFKDYHPHMTLGYVKPGSNPQIDDNSMFNGKNYVFDEFVYSSAGMEDQYDIIKNG